MTVNPLALKYFSVLALVGALFMALTVADARAAQLVVFEQDGCVWCEAFDSQVGAVYDKTEDGLRAPLRRVDIDRPLPPDLAFIQVERLTPLFVLVDQGREIGRIRGYGGREMFWSQLSTLMQKLDTYDPGTQRAQLLKTASRACG